MINMLQQQESHPEFEIVNSGNSGGQEIAVIKEIRPDMFN